MSTQPPIEFQTDEAAQLWAYWRALPRIGLMPRKTDISPAHLRNILARLVMLKLVSPSEFRLTLVGTDHVDMVGQELTGANYLDLVPEQRRAETVKRMWAAISHPVANHFIYRMIARTGRVVTCETLHLPLADEDGTPRYILAVSPELEGEAYDLDHIDRGVEVTEILSHTYIDIGAGVPPD